MQCTHLCRSHCDILPATVLVEAAVDVVLQGDGEPVHERGAWGDRVAVKQLRLVFDRDLDALLGKLLSQALLLFFLDTPHVGDSDVI